MEIYHSIRLNISMETLKAEIVLTGNNSTHSIVKEIICIKPAAAIWTLFTNVNAAYRILKIKFCREQIRIDS